VNSLPLSESMPSTGKGNFLLAWSMAQVTWTAALFFTDRLIVNPL
jgi:hypothetical protein